MLVFLLILVLLPAADYPEPAASYPGPVAHFPARFCHPDSNQVHSLLPSKNVFSYCTVTIRQR